MSSGQIILINKPIRWTSFDVVKKVQNILKNQHSADAKSTEIKSPSSNPNFKTKNPKLKVGHAGTLDPLATGLLILCTDKMTKRIAEIQDAEKEYTGTFMIGSTTPSYDLETETCDEKSYAHVTNELIFETIKKFTGKISQTPPAHSAVKINGVRAYEKARKGQVVDLKPREVNIKEFEITSINLPKINVRVVCSKGTYIRSLAHDFGRELGCGAHLSSLCRTRIGDYLLINSIDIEEFTKKHESIEPTLEAVL